MKKDPNALSEDPSAKIIPFIRRSHHPLRAEMPEYDRYLKNKDIADQSPIQTIFVRAASPEVTEQEVHRYVSGARGKVIEVDQGLMRVEIRQSNLEALKYKSSYISIIEPAAP